MTCWSQLPNLSRQLPKPSQLANSKIFEITTCAGNRGLIGVAVLTQPRRLVAKFKKSDEAFFAQKSGTFERRRERRKKTMSRWIIEARPMPNHPETRELR